MQETMPATGPALHIVDMSIRWSDLDADRRLNCLQILRFADEARVQWVDAIGASTEASNRMPIVETVGCTSYSPIGHRAAVQVSLHCDRVGKNGVHLVFKMRDAVDASIHFATANLVLVWVDKLSGKAAAVPENLRALCEQFLPRQHTGARTARHAAAA